MKKLGGRATRGQAIQFSTIRPRLSWRHGDNDTTIKTNGRLHLAGGKDRAFFVGRSTGGQAMQFSSIRRYDYLGDMATTTNGKLYLAGGKDRALFVGRSTGGQAMQFSSIRRYDYLGDMATTTNGKLYLAGGKDRALFVGRSTGGQAMQFSSIRRYDYLGDMATTIRLTRPMENYIWLGDDQLEGKRCSFPRFDDTITLATWRQRHDNQGQWKTVSGWGTINWRASDAVFLDSTIRLPWRHGDNDTTNKTNGKLYLAGGKDRALFVGRSTGGQAMQFSTVRRRRFLGGMATTTRQSRPMENCIWLGDDQLEGKRCSFARFDDDAYRGGMATMIRWTRPTTESCIWLGDDQLDGKRYSFSWFDNDEYLGDMRKTLTITRVDRWINQMVRRVWVYAE
ncbi:hypothetical protein BDC45DRAFT_534661 [Circinella umbellata]|nr:hypothetical protein BDC45DRAFT_534661 [Circinella umbellata]